LKKDRFIIGTRGSELALWQTNWVKDKLQKSFPSLSFETEIIKTKGDKILASPLSNIGDKGLFTREIEKQLLSDSIDLAVHSLKDLPTVLPEGLTIGAVSERIDQRDVLISKKYESIDDLPQGAKVATGSLRRKSQLLNYRSDLNIVDIRGNLNSRFMKFDESDIDAMILAYAGVNRLAINGYIKAIIPTDVMLPATCQGIMAVEVRENDKAVMDIVKVINNRHSEIESRAERSFLNRLEGGCQIPVGVYSRSADYSMYMEGMVGTLDGRIVIRERIIGNDSKPEELGINLALMMLEKGAKPILKEIRNAVNNEKANA
jgi:hydroxymethylbilane synthase